MKALRLHMLVLRCGMQDPIVINERQQAFAGHVYYRRANGYYQRTSGPGKVDLLHRAVWEAAHGPILGVRREFHVHHRDEDRANNALANLELIAANDHIGMHMRTDEARSRARAHMARISPLARTWHASEEGREWHRHHSHAVAAKMAARAPVEHACEMCGEPFFVREAYRDAARFCSPRCRAANTRAQRRAGVPVDPKRQVILLTDPKPRVCVDCGATFQSRSGRALRCEPCGTTHTRELARLAYKARRNP